jgi:hypothetical protein
MSEIIIERVDAFVDAFVDKGKEEDKVVEVEDNIVTGSSVVADRD